MLGDSEKLKHLRKTFPDPEEEGASLSVWYHDGSVILRSEGVGFRVYQGILSAKSHVLRDLFDIPKLIKQELLEGCPVVDMEDAYIDLYYFLTALHDHQAFFDGHQWERSSALSAVLRLGKKYDVNILCEMATRRLEKVFPSSLDDWQNGGEPEIKFTTTALQLVREFGITGILPTVAYECCRHMQAEADTEETITLLGKNLPFVTRFQTRLTRVHAELFGVLFFDSGSRPQENPPDVPTTVFCSTPHRCNKKKIIHLQAVLLFSHSEGLMVFEDSELPQGEGTNSWDNVLCSACLDRTRGLFESELKRQWGSLAAICEELLKLEEPGS